MSYSVQNSETGEVDYIPSDTNETIQFLNYDEETGEPIKEELKVRYIKLKRFKIPKKLLKGNACEEFVRSLTGEDQYNENSKGIECKIIDELNEKIIQNKYQYNRDDYMSMEGVKNDIILAYNKSNILLFLIPTLFCFSIYMALLCSLVEMFLHCWSHIKNGLNMNKKIYFRSPLHVLTSQFCATCRWESENTIETFRTLNKQMRQAREFKSLKNVTKALS